MIPRSKDVAELAGVSRSTVSQILNGHGELFTEATRTRVRAAVAELRYQPSAAGRTLARGSSDLVIMLVPNTTFGSNLQDIFESMTRELASRGMTLLLRLSHDTAEELDRLVMGLKPRAVMSILPLPTGQRTVLVDRGIEVIEPDASTGTDTNAEIGAVQARFLIEKGYTKLAYAHLRDSRSDLLGEPRERRFAEECAKHGLDAPRILFLGLSPGSAKSTLDRLGARGFAVGCYNDDVATALLSAATKRGWRVPEDLALIGMDNTALSQLTIPSLTTLGYDATTAINSSVQELVARLEPSVVTGPAVDVHLRVIDRETA